MRWRRLRILLILIGVAAGLAALFVGLHLSLGAYRRAKIACLIARHQANPTQQTADELAAMLDSRVLSTEEGNKLLKVLMTPRVIARQSYATGKPVSVKVTWPFRVSFQTLVVDETGTSYVDDKELSSYVTYRGLDYSVWQGVLGGRSELVRLDRAVRAVAVPGSCRFVQRYRTDLYAPPLRHSSTWPSHRRFPLSLLPRKWTELGRCSFAQDQLLYQCVDAAAVDIRIVEADQAEKLEVRSGPELDKAMQAAFSTPRVFFAVVWVCGIPYANLPENAVLRWIFRDPSGKETSVGDVLMLLAGTSGTLSTRPTPLDSMPPGTYSCTILLVADPEAAYEDPELKTVWGGTLEFPFTVTIPPVPLREPQPAAADGTQE